MCDIMRKHHIYKTHTVSFLDAHFIMHRVPLRSPHRKQSPIKYSSFKYFKSSRVLHAASHTHIVVYRRTIMRIHHARPPVRPSPHRARFLVYFIRSLLSPFRAMLLLSGEMVYRGTHIFRTSLETRLIETPVENMNEYQTSWCDMRNAEWGEELAKHLG